VKPPTSPDPQRSRSRDHGAFDDGRAKQWSPFRSLRAEHEFLVRPPSEPGQEAGTNFKQTLQSAAVPTMSCRPR
jgi:hypothetical protein